MSNSNQTKYTVCRDIQEKSGYWNFCKSSLCEGTIVQNMKTGDYTLVGMEEFFTIERKANTGEFSGNITQKRFERELARMDKMDQAYLVLEFTWDDVDSFPYKSGIPTKFWPDLRVTSKFLRKRIFEFMSDYNIQIILAGNRGEEIAEQIFKRMNVLYGQAKN